MVKAFNSMYEFKKLILLMSMCGNTTHYVLKNLSIMVVEYMNNKYLLQKPKGS